MDKFTDNPWKGVDLGLYQCELPEALEQVWDKLGFWPVDYCEAHPEYCQKLFEDKLGELFAARDCSHTGSYGKMPAEKFWTPELFKAFCVKVFGNDGYLDVQGWKPRGLKKGRLMFFDSKKESCTISFEGQTNMQIAGHFLFACLQTKVNPLWARMLDSQSGQALRDAVDHRGGEYWAEPLLKK